MSVCSLSVVRSEEWDDRRQKVGELFQRLVHGVCLSTASAAAFNARSDVRRVQMGARCLVKADCLCMHTVYSTMTVSNSKITRVRLDHAVSF